GESRAHAHDVSAKETRRVHKVARMREDEITALVCFGISFRTFRAGALADDRLEIVRHRITMRGIAIPGLQRNHLPEFFANKFLRESDARIEATIVADLKRDA